MSKEPQNQEGPMVWGRSLPAQPCQPRHCWGFVWGENTLENRRSLGQWGLAPKSPPPPAGAWLG